MRRFLPFLLLLLFTSSQTFSQHLSKNVELVSNWFDSNIAFDGNNNTYNEVWGFTWKGREYAVIGCKSGAYILDVSDDFYPRLVEFIPGGDTTVINRDYDSFKGHLYMVADQGENARLQIVDYTGLPDTVALAYDTNLLIQRCHNIFIDSVAQRLYGCSVTKNGLTKDLSIYDISSPANPELLLEYDAIAVFHDIFVRNDTAFGNNAREGMFVYDFTDLNRVKVIGAVIDYPEKGYNHSGWSTEDNRYYYFADETHGSDIKICDIRNIDDIEVVGTFNAGTDEEAMVHNLIVKGNFLYVSYYHDGLRIYNISDPVNPVQVGFYDTYPLDDYVGGKGAWGVYPFLPSGNILVSDRERGLFVIDPSTALGIDLNPSDSNFVEVYPNPFVNDLKITILEGQNLQKITLYDIQGREVWNGSPQSKATSMVISDLQDLNSGVYIIKLEGKYLNATKRLVKSHNP